MKDGQGKIIVFDGDSICHATSEREHRGGGWALRVGEALGMTWYNVGVSGATVTAEQYGKNGDARHWVSRSIDRIHEQYPTVDYLILEGGTNDADNLGIGSPIYGTYDPEDFSGKYDDTTYTGALESLFYKAITYYPAAKIGFIVAQKMGCETVEHARRRFYFDRAIEICRKWGIPYLDLWESHPLNPMLDVYFMRGAGVDANHAEGRAYADGQHLTSHGYDLVSDRITRWVETL